MTEDEAKIAFKNARSFIDKYQPNGAQKIGTMKSEKTGMAYIIYKDKQGKYWYKSKKIS